MLNKLRVLIILTLICFQFITPAFAIDYTADQLYKDCLKNLDANNNIQITVNEQFEAGFCVGYIKGLDDMLSIHYSMTKSKSKKIWLYCLPDNTSLNDMSAAFVDYMKNHPEQGNDYAGTVLIKALMDKFHC